jgi:two-component system, OmpR family, sensor histidine kinase KdpD
MHPPTNDFGKAPVRTLEEIGKGRRGRLKIFLGYAPGVGKTFSMLDEAHRRKRRGQDVVVGFIDAHGRQSIAEHLGDLEVIPPRFLPNDVHPIVDVEAIVRRKPGVVLVDALEAVNPPGAIRSTRSEDVEAILEAGVAVLTTLDVYQLESLADHFEDITGLKAEHAVPDRLLHEADEVEMVDVTPRALINRLERGDVYDADLIPGARDSLFREGNLNALRELALREIAVRVDEDLAEYRKEKRIEKPWAAHDRVMVCISPTRSSLRMLRRGWRMCQRMHGDVFAVYVESEAPTPREKKILESDFALAEKLGIPIVKIKGEVAEELIKYAQQNNVTQIVLGHSQRTRMQEILRGSILSELARELKTIDIIVVASDTVESA